MSKPIVKSKNVVNLPDGLYSGNVGGYGLTIVSQDYFGKKIELEYGIRTMNLAVIVIVKNGFAYCFDHSISKS